jgi:hypothetical protein
MKIFVATYESGSGCGWQTVKTTRKEAETWLKKQHKRDFDQDEAAFKEWCKYGAWTGKIRSYNIK